MSDPVKRSDILDEPPKHYCLTGEVAFFWEEDTSQFRGFEPFPVRRIFVQRYTLLTQPDVWVRVKELRVTP